MRDTSLAMRLNSESAICWGWRPLPENSSWPEGEQYVSSSPGGEDGRLRRIHFHVAHALTGLARATSEVGRAGLTDPSRGRCIHALQHRVLRFLMALMKHDANRYLNDIFVRLILERPEDLALQRPLQEVVDRLLAQRSLTTSPAHVTDVLWRATTAHCSTHHLYWRTLTPPGGVW